MNNTTNNTTTAAIADKVKPASVKFYFNDGTLENADGWKDAELLLVDLVRILPSGTKFNFEPIGRRGNEVNDAVVMAEFPEDAPIPDASHIGLLKRSLNRYSTISAVDYYFMGFCTGPMDMWKAVVRYLKQQGE